MLRRSSQWCLLLGLLALTVTIQPSGAAVRDRLLVVRIAATPAQAAQLEREGIDLVEARDGPDVLAIVDDTRLRVLRAVGWDVREQQTLVGAGTRPLDTFPAGYRSVAMVEALLHSWNAQYPGLVELRDYGDSWEREQQATAGHDLWALRLTDEAVHGPKPRFFLLATIHARELATTEVALRWAEELLARRDQDRLVAELLRTREIWIVPLANPDGRIKAEGGVLWRKNTNHVDAPCSDEPGLFSQPGVDLNRNSDWAWGTVNSPSTTPSCAQTFPGPAPHSEPEVAALAALLRELFPPRLSDTDEAGCEERRRDTSGLLITLHSYGNLVLYPWGHTEREPCMARELRAIARSLAAFNGYQADQSIMLYPTSGTTDDWSYGELGIASFTFEIGPIDGKCEGFFPAFSCVDRFFAENRQALYLAAGLAADPYAWRPRVYVPLTSR